MIFEDLRTDQPYDSLGMWWLPSNPSYKVRGKLIFSPDAGARIECQQKLLPGYHHGLVVHGDLQSGDPITVLGAYDCRIEFGAVDHQELLASRLLVGGHFESLDATTIDHLSCHFSSFNQWFSEGVLKPDHHKTEDRRPDQYDLSITADQEPISLGKVKRHDAELYIGLAISERGGQFSFSVDANYSLSVCFSKSVTLAEGIRWAFRFEMLLSLLVGKASPIELLSFRSTSSDSAGYYLGQRTWKPQERYFARQLMPANYDDIKDQISSTVDAWFETYDRFEPILELLASVIYRSDGFVEERFLTLAQAMEGFCRIESNDTYVGKNDFKAIRRAMIEAIPAGTSERLHSKIENSIGSLNDYTLRDRLLALFDRRQRLREVVACRQDSYQSTAPVEDFCAKVARLRNRLTHVESDSRRNIDFQELYDLTIMLKAVLCGAVLERCGVFITDHPNRLRLGVANTIWW